MFGIRIFYTFYGKYLLLLTIYISAVERRYLNIDRPTLLSRDYIYWGTSYSDELFRKYEQDFSWVCLIKPEMLTHFKMILLMYD